MASSMCDTPTGKSEEGGRAAASCGGWSSNLLDNRAGKVLLKKWKVRLKTT